VASVRGRSSWVTVAAYKLAILARHGFSLAAVGLIAGYLLAKTSWRTATATSGLSLNSPSTPSW